MSLIYGGDKVNSRSCKITTFVLLEVRTLRLSFKRKHAEGKFFLLVLTTTVYHTFCADLSAVKGFVLCYAYARCELTVIGLLNPSR